MSDYKLNTRCVQGGYTPGNGEPRQIPIIQSTTFKYDTSDQMGRLFDLEEAGYFYTRLQNPTNDAVAAKIADLEGGIAAMLTSSGQAANYFAVFNICEAGDHIVASSSLYGGTFNLLGTMDAVENVALPLMFRGIPKKERMAKADKMLDLVGLSKHKDHRPNEMSGGQQQRVGVARALVLDPEIIFADEPTGNLDSNTSAEVMRLMQKVVRERNQTLVMVTHDNHLASFADRIFHIIDGKIVKIEDNRNREEKRDEK